MFIKSRQITQNTDESNPIYCFHYFTIIYFVIFNSYKEFIYGVLRTCFYNVYVWNERPVGNWRGIADRSIHKRPRFGRTHYSVDSNKPRAALKAACSLDNEFMTKDRPVYNLKKLGVTILLKKSTYT